MGYETERRTFPCQCGSGKLIGEWEEHDTWPGTSRHIEWRFECPECAGKYVFYPRTDRHIVQRLDADRLAAMMAEYQVAFQKFCDLAAQRYEDKWTEYVATLPTKRAMHEVIGSGSYGTFLKRATSRERLDFEAKAKFHFNPMKCLNWMGIQDSEVSVLHAEAEKLRSAKDTLWESVDKHPVPMRGH